MSRYDVFVSYNHKDAEIVRRLVEALETHGLTVWYDNESIRVGENFMREIEGALEQSQVFLLVISPDYLSSQWDSFELGVALSRAASAKGSYLLPVLVRPSVLPPPIRRHEVLDATELPAEQVAAKVAEVVRHVEMAGGAKS